MGQWMRPSEGFSSFSPLFLDLELALSYPPDPQVRKIHLPIDARD
jgi:hypothetical protein